MDEAVREGEGGLCLRAVDEGCASDVHSVAREIALEELRKPVRAAFLEQLEKNTNPYAALASLVKYRLGNKGRYHQHGFRYSRYRPLTGKEILLLPDGGDPAAAEPCRPDDLLLVLLTSKNADGSARGGWKWLGPRRVEMQFHAMIQLQDA